MPCAGDLDLPPWVSIFAMQDIYVLALAIIIAWLCMSLSLVHLWACMRLYEVAGACACTLLVSTSSQKNLF